MTQPKLETKEEIEAFLAELDRMHEETMRDVRRLTREAWEALARPVY